MLMFQMLPYGAQGSNQAIEDAGALGYLLKGIKSSEEVAKRLSMFEEVRRKRVSRVQTLSKKAIGEEMKVQDELKKYRESDEMSEMTRPQRGIHPTKS